MPPTFHIASLNHIITQSIQGYPKSWPGANSLSSRSSQSEVMPIFLAKKMLFLGDFFFKNWFFRPNGWLQPIACHTYLESLCISGQFKLSGNHFNASYEASEFCWQIGFNFLQHIYNRFFDTVCHSSLALPWIYTKTTPQQKQTMQTIKPPKWNANDDDSDDSD